MFWACGHCNGVKNKKKYDPGILDCCKTDPEQKIIFRLKQNDIELHSQAAVPDQETARTIELIKEVFNLKNTGLRIYKSDMRLKALQKEMNLLFDNLEKLKEDPGSRLVLRKLRVLLRRESAFAAFKRCYVRERLSDYPELEPFVR